MTNFSYAFFGTGALAESVLAALVRNGHVPKLIITKPDAPQGRHMQLTAPYIKTWAEMKGISVLQPIKLDAEFCRKLSTVDCQLFIVASYGKIIPENILSIPRKGTLNVHPSLLPLYRGPSPIQSALLDGAMTMGLSIMRLDNEMDHGPILTQTSFAIDEQATAGTLEVTCGQLGGDLLAEVIPHYLDGTLIPKEQDHSKATICKKIEKELGLITLETRADVVQRKFRALSPWPGLYFFIKHHDKNLRVKITMVDLSLIGSETLVAGDVIQKVIPEGKKEIDWESFKRGYLQ